MSMIDNNNNRRAEKPTKTPDIASRIMESMVLMPPKHHEDMKLGTRKHASQAKQRPASKGRVHKGKTRT
jgi:hypothetical protein